MSAGIQNFVAKRERAETTKQKRASVDTRLVSNKFSKPGPDE